MADQAAAAVRSGGVIVYPTETVYGLGCDPADAEAVARIRRVKGRDAARPMLALTDAWSRVEGWLVGLTDVHRRLMEHDPPLPVTVVFDAAPDAPPGLVSTAGGIGIRRTTDPFCLALVAAAGPVLSTSANRAGEPPARRFADLDPAVTAAADLAVDAGQALGGTPSTVVRVEGGRLAVLREGAVDAATLRAIIDP
ncbi:MAG: L-threonylcarbamoyladenylate synthase [Bacteroidota bacterium]